MTDLSIIIPCYNEADNIGKLEQELIPIARSLYWPSADQPAPFERVEIIFVDDGSRDGTFEAISTHLLGYDSPELAVRIEKHPVNRGLGAAMRTGFQAAGGDVILTTDSDGTYRHDEIPQLLARLREGVDIVTASPYHPQGGVANVPGYRLVLSRGSSMLYRLLTDWRIHTYTALFRAYRREVIKNVSFEADGFLAGTELMVKAMMMGYRVGEYPTVLHSRVHGVSKAKIWQTIRAHLAFQLRILRARVGMLDKSQFLAAPGPGEVSRVNQ